jgi:cell division protein ZapA
MAKVELHVGARIYEVYCRDGEEDHFRAMAAVLDAKAADMTRTLGGMTENRMLLFAGPDAGRRAGDAACGRENSSAAPDPRPARAVQALAARIERLAEALEAEGANVLDRRWRALPGTSPRKIPEAIHHPRGLSLPGSWSDAHGPHLTLQASEDIPANGHGGPATLMAASDKLESGEPHGQGRTAQATPRSPARFLAEPATTAHRLVFTLQIAERIVPHFAGARMVSAYVSDGMEVDPMPILFQALDAGLGIALPRVTPGDPVLRFHHWLPGDELVPGRSG